MDKFFDIMDFVVAIVLSVILGGGALAFLAALMIMAAQH